MRWVNHHLAEAQVERRISNFSGDLKDSYAFVVLLHQLAPKVCTLDALNEPNLQIRAGLALDSAERLGCRKFLSVDDVLQGNQRLNFAFLAYLFTRFNQPPKLAENKVVSERLDEQAIELVDLHKDSRATRITLNKAQDKVKEMGQRIAQEREEVKQEEDARANRILSLEEYKAKQAETYTAKIETLKHKVAEAQAAQLPSVEELQHAIAVEEAEQEALLKEREIKREELAELKVDVAARVAVRNKEEQLLTTVNNEIKKMESEHSTKAKSISEKIVALGLPELQKKIDEAIAHNDVITAKNATLTRN
jgi:hypothetical protein